MMKTTPFWIKGVALPRIGSLQKNLEVNVVVIGGGITGITTACLLRQAGAKVALLERDTFATGDTGHTTAHLTYVPDLRVAALVKVFGEGPARGVIEAGNAALHQIHELVEIRRGIWNYLTEDKDYPYYYLRDRWLEPEAESLRAVKRGEGKILHVKGERVAAHRDAGGKVHMKSAVCPHMGCIVRWNDAERTWDCPCHGSRFHGAGKVMAGPAETDLAEPKKS